MGGIGKTSKRLLSMQIKLDDIFQRCFSIGLRTRGSICVTPSEMPTLRPSFVQAPQHMPYTPCGLRME
ncbi:hypothetical protein AAHA92_30485 [Salvia divinorum]|uniref:Uncharacterized protein n=1 Tax=Salvia divinorum TaxID=28513 RepID=A0ABD1FR17_SALDI